MFRRLIPVLALLAAPAVLHGHEVWISPEQYQVAPGDTIAADIRNGQEFRGIALAWFDNRVARAEAAWNGGTRTITGRAGDIPALRLADAPEGLVRLVYQSSPSTVRYASWDRFQAFLDHKDLGARRATHEARGLPLEGFSEVYTRFVKSLVKVGNGGGQDAPAGLELELVALANPYTDTLDDGLPVRLLYQGRPRADAQIEIFDRAPDGTVSITTTRTDATGGARIDVTAGHDYLVDSVVLREPDPATAARHEAAWESLWAALTFAVPNQDRD